MSEEKPVKRPRGRHKGSGPTGGSFKKGDVKNPKGRPKSDHSLRDLIRKNHASVYDLLMEIAQGGSLKEPYEMKDRRWAIDTILDRGWGKVPISAPISDDPENSGNGGTTIIIGGTDANA